MKYFLDTEFIERGPDEPVRLISLALVSEDGREYYAENRECDMALASAWVLSHVVPHLTGPQKPRSQIAQELLTFIGPDPEPQIWAYYGAYDWLLFCQLYGTLIKMPQALPHFCYDLKQLANHLGIPKSLFPAQRGTKHHALEDARWNKELFTMLSSWAQKGVFNLR